MRKTEDYLELFTFNPNTITDEALSIIKQAQIDAIKETCERCSENANWEYTNHRFQIPEEVSYVGGEEYGYNYIDKNSILSVADKLIKELQDGNKD